MVVEDFCSTWTPIDKNTWDAIIPFVGESIATWVEIISEQREHLHYLHRAVRRPRAQLSHQHAAHSPIGLGLHQQYPGQLGEPS